MEPFAIPPLVNIAHFPKVNNSERARDGASLSRPWGRGGFFFTLAWFFFGRIIQPNGTGTPIRKSRSQKPPSPFKLRRD